VGKDFRHLTHDHYQGKLKREADQSIKLIIEGFEVMKTLGRFAS